MPPHRDAPTSERDFFGEDVSGESRPPRETRGGKRETARREAVVRSSPSPSAPATATATATVWPQYVVSQRTRNRELPHIESTGPPGGRVRG